MKAKILKFDNDCLIGSKIKSGYRIKINELNDDQNILNFLCNNFGECNLVNNQTMYQKIDNDNSWELVKNSITTTIILSNYHQYLSFIKFFNIVNELTYYTVEQRISNIFEDYYHSKITQKIIDQIRERISKEFDIDKFKITIEKDFSLIKLFNYNIRLIS